MAELMGLLLCVVLVANICLAISSLEDWITYSKESKARKAAAGS